jgi:hypothetical protein
MVGMSGPLDERRDDAGGLKRVREVLGILIAVFKSSEDWSARGADG